ncbi:MAG: phenylalanine--tRNA ligase subunit beta [Thermodesulfobacteria bacterium]|nr:phenylalanine--tRNA ligase subunit beta [Thermodesulfobacteriota bacterium]
MLVPSSWLRQMVAIEADDNELAESLTLAGLEVEAVEPAYPWLLSAEAARISRVETLDGAKNITACTVETSNGEVQVVCGAPNVQEGMLTAYVPPGTQMPDGKEVSESVLYGRTSQGMLASEYELLLEGDASGIFDILKKYPEARLGQSIADITKIHDTVFEIGVTPNRPDCLSILGVAREAAALFHAKVSFSEPGLDEDQPLEGVPIRIDDPDLCNRYVGAAITGVKVAPSPGWLARRLLASGVRPINNIVDVTNYVLLELGQPLHAFDMNKLAGPEIIVRRARQGEKVVTLDGKERELTKEMLLICDRDRPVAIAGVMGGLDSEVTELTRDVLIESAWFYPPNIRRTAKALKLSTEASYRFERGVDPAIQKVAALRACQLILELAGGTYQGVKDENPVPYTPREVEYRPKRINRLLGTDISAQDMAAILESLEFEVEKADEDLYKTVPPSFRGDVKAEEDIVEEVARCHGFSKIPTQSPVATLIVKRPESFKPFMDRVRGALAGEGFSEIISYSFIAPWDLKNLKLPKEDIRNKAVKLKNPLAEDQSIMRTTLVPCMLSTISRNLRRRNLSLSLFEVGAVFIDKGPGVIPDEHQRCCCAITGSRFPESWAWPEQEVDFFDIKGTAENLLDILNCQDCVFIPSQSPETFYVPGTQLDIKAGDVVLGTLGQIDQAVAKSFGISQKVFLMDLSLSALAEVATDRKTFSPLDRFPSVERDLSIILDDSVRAQDVLDFIAQNRSSYLESFYIFDVYKGKQVPKGKKSLGIHFVYRAKDRTLSEQEVEKEHEPLTKGVLENFKGSLRS